MQQQGSEYAGVSPEMLSFGSTGRAQMLAGGGGSEQAEAASPISSRPPASINFDELGDDPDRAGGSGGISSGNRWPRPETLALLKIRSEMDIAFRDATLKGPLWDEVSRKLAELGYVRSAKKCKEKFENVHKYYKRTKEGRAGRQDGKSYRFFTQLEALQGATTAAAPTSTGSGGLNLLTSTATPAIPTAAGSVGNIQFANPVSVGMVGGLPTGAVPSFQPFTVYPSAATAVPGSGAQPVPAAPGVGISFSSDSASSGSYGSDEDEEEFDDMSEEDLDRPGSNPAGGAQKRKRGGGGGKRRMMDFFEGLMKQVMQKQEAMQQRFLEIIEKREQDRMMREEIWKRQEAARLSREQELAAHDRAIAASRDAAIVSFLQKITGQSIQLPPAVYTAPPSAPAIPPPAATPASPCRQQFHQQAQRHPSQNTEHQMPPPSSDVIMAIPERQIPPQDAQTGGGGGSSSEAASSRWPKAEVLALIKLRSNLENRYQEAGPKGPLWEEISAGMQQMGYVRSSKRCKEKWENINKYFKKVKESNKKRPEDAKTCPYFDELDALYQRKRLSSGSTRPFQQGLPGTTMDQETPVSNTETVQTDAVEPNNGGGGLGDTIFGDEGSNAGGSRKPEDIMKEQQHELNSEKMDELGESTDNNEEEDEYRKMGYKIEFQRSPSSNKNGFITMVQ